MFKLKVCGMRNSENINDLIKVQPDFIGFIFHGASSRNVTETIDVTIPKSIKKVGVFVNKSKDFIQDKIKQYQLDFVQLHGQESPEFCIEIKKLDVGIIKAFNISEEFNFSTLKDYETICDYFLFDAFGKKPGGNGITFNWSSLANYNGKTPFLLSGGIDDTMTNELKKITHPQFVGIDINSGFETATAFKNIQKINSFKNELHS